jgi:hypothetical protein
MGQPPGISILRTEILEETMEVRLHGRIRVDSGRIKVGVGFSEGKESRWAHCTIRYHQIHYHQKQSHVRILDQER